MSQKTAKLNTAAEINGQSAKQAVANAFRTWKTNGQGRSVATLGVCKNDNGVFEDGDDWQNFKKGTHPLPYDKAVSLLIELGLHEHVDQLLQVVSPIVLDRGKPKVSVQQPPTVSAQQQTVRQKIADVHSVVHDFSVVAWVIGQTIPSTTTHVDGDEKRGRVFIAEALNARRENKGSRASDAVWEYLVQDGPDICLAAAKDSPKLTYYETAIWLVDKRDPETVTDDDRRILRKLAQKFTPKSDAIEQELLVALIMRCTSALYEIAPFIRLLNYATKVGRYTKPQQDAIVEALLNGNANLVTRIGVAQAFVARDETDDIIENWIKGQPIDRREVGHYAIKYRFAKTPALISSEAAAWLATLNDEFYPARGVLTECLLALASQPSARTVLAELDNILKVQPKLGASIGLWEYTERIFASYQAVRSVVHSWSPQVASNYFHSEKLTLVSAENCLMQLTGAGYSDLNLESFLQLGVDLKKSDEEVTKLLSWADNDTRIKLASELIWSHPSWEVGERMSSHLRDRYDGYNSKPSEIFPSFVAEFLTHKNWHVVYAATEFCFQCRSLKFRDCSGRDKWNDAVGACHSAINVGGAISFTVGLCVENVCLDILDCLVKRESVNRDVKGAKTLVDKHEKFLQAAMESQCAYVLDLGHGLWSELHRGESKCKEVLIELPQVKNSLLPDKWWTLEREEFLKQIESRKLAAVQASPAAPKSGSGTKPKAAKAATKKKA